ncbi:MAG: hypothetical protein DHS20C02_00390 [Micavibrio sp.]|nr:MAG: hypothetical protein DHS20C02_00390 [Micavibrio sp.]
MAEFFEMNGYGLYIWGAYGATGAIFFALFALTLYKTLRLKRERRLLEKE